jgi:mono/diheme cytochrome c family protein
MEMGGRQMNKTKMMCVLAAALCATQAVAADKPAKATRDAGKAEFAEHCVVCHGADGTGNGSYVELLKKAPPDLTTLSKRNGGVFPLERVAGTIDGRQLPKSHGERDMPIWGSRYVAETVRAAEYYVDTPYDMEMYARARVLSLVDYLNRIQKK